MNEFSTLKVFMSTSYSPSLVPMKADLSLIAILLIYLLFGEISSPTSRGIKIHLSVS
tara:strand:+ start:1444 stop:1614 length:171 start_codon:yes stop_codon:yes gene_type:complete